MLPNPIPSYLSLLLHFFIGGYSPESPNKAREVTHPHFQIIQSCITNAKISLEDGYTFIIFTKANGVAVALSKSDSESKS